ncbi:hypothetical protein TELCIR_03538 [Teladorsagia circumcincta]|uniref:Peptidase M16 N-terminal domain-containing protein n=1 Tax=Teladorsagia circumcincta TaxID=45464 RepID=A0A2G9UXL8_TELCI|nr:hypothetical protein TELCIR_03538 [Teladorsagia circumcincta]
MFRAGSRYEGPNQHGLVHYLRDSVGTDSANYPGLSLIWSSAVSGGRVSAFSTRDVYGVSLALPRDESSVGISILGHIAQPAFKPWEIEDGGEWRRPAGGSVAHVLLAGAGASLSDAKAMATQAVLLASLGRSAAVQFSGSAGNAAVLRAVAGTCGASAFQAAYEDSGLVGVYIVADGAHVAKAVTSAASAIKSYKCTDLEAAKRRATNDLLRASAHSYPTSIDRATQILAGITTEGAIVEAIQQVTAADVEAAAKKLSSKFSLSSYGNIDEVPYVDSL